VSEDDADCAFSMRKGVRKVGQKAENQGSPHLSFSTFFVIHFSVFFAHLYSAKLTNFCFACSPRYAFLPIFF
jgi:hypothetical protein